MKKIFLLLAAVALLANAQTGEIMRSTPAQESVNPQAVATFFDSLMAVNATDIHHVMVLRHDKVIAELHPAPYRAQDSHTLYSCSKTFTSMAVGIAIDENRLRLTDRVAAFFPERLPDTVSARLADITVRDLLIMGAGIKPDWIMRSQSPDWITEWLSKPVTEAPGSKFQYDSMCSYILAAIIQRVTGKTMLEYLNEHLFGPMGITEVDWEQSPEGVNTGGWGLRLQTESLAKMGMLMLHRGNWNGRQLVPAAWIDEASASHINYSWVKPGDKPTDKNQGYGYQIWRCNWPGAYRADGAYGQFIVVIPESDMVVVINGYSDDTNGELRAIWRHLMPGVDKTNSNPGKAQKNLEALCSKASLPVLKGKDINPLPAGAKLKLQSNKHNIATIELTPMSKFSTMYIHYADGHSDCIYLGHGNWMYGPVELPPYSIDAVDRFKGLNRNFQAAGCRAWTDKNVLTARIEYVNWISATTFVFDFKENKVTITDNFDASHPEVVTFK